MSKSIEIQNLEIIVEKLKGLLDEVDKANITNETLNFIHRQGKYAATKQSDKNDVNYSDIRPLTDVELRCKYFQALELILIHSRQSEKIRVVTGSYKKAVAYIALAAICTALLVGVAALAIGGAIALAFIYPVIILFSFFFVPPAVAAGFCGLGGILSLGDESNKLLQKADMKIASHNAWVKKGSTAYTKMVSFFESDNNTASEDTQDRKDEELKFNAL